MTPICLHRIDRIFAESVTPIYVNADCVISVCRETKEYTRVEFIGGSSVHVVESAEQIVDDMRLASGKPARHMAKVA